MGGKLNHKMLPGGITFLQNRKNSGIIGVQIKVNLDLRVAEYGNKKENLTFIKNNYL
jgi:hypothetical protein